MLVGRVAYMLEQQVHACLASSRATRMWAITRTNCISGEEVCYSAVPVQGKVILLQY